MKRRFPAVTSLLVVSALAVTASGLTAQDDDDDRGPSRVYSILTSRPRLGVTLDTRPNKDTDKYGARISGVTPDGPADKAGLKTGDIITRINGTSLGGVSPDDADESGPATRLITVARTLDPGDTVRIEYRRAGQSRNTTLVAEDLGVSVFGPTGRMSLMRPKMDLDIGPELRRMPFSLNTGPEGTFSVMLGGPLGGLELADVGPDLGEYFGVKEGVLVLKASSDSTLPFKAGDVITAIDGRTPTSVSHARRILASYAAGETARIDVMRKRQKVTLTWKAPEEQEGRMFFRTPAEGRSKVRVERS